MSEDIQKPEKEQDTTQNTCDEPTEDLKFKERGNFFIKEFDEKLQEEDIKLAFAIIIDPKHKQPIVYTRGNTYALTRLLVDTARYFKERLNQELAV